MKYILALSLPLLMAFSCSTEIPKCPKCKVYTGDSSIQALVRKQDNEFIYSDTNKFDKVKAFTDEGFKAFIKTYINGCAKWKDINSLDTQFWDTNSEQFEKLSK